MDKLIELLNEFNEEMCWHPWLLYQWFWVRKWDMNFIFNHSKFPFIKWLVDNDKIKWSEKTAFVTFLEREINANKSDALVSLLAVQDNPIEYLCSILK